MTALPDLMIDDDPFDFGTFGSPVQTAVSSAIRLDKALLEMLGTEMDNIAGRIAASASVANSFALPQAANIEIRLIARYLPQRPNIYPVVIGRLAAASAPTPLVNVVQHFYARLDAVSESTRAALETGVVTRAQLHFLADAWQEMCCAAIETGDAINARLAELQSEQRVLRRSLAQLTRAAAGGSPCIGVDGVIEIPGLTDRRRAPRYHVNWYAEAIVDGREIAIVVEDVSRQGVGATCSHHLARGSMVEVLLCERRLPGRVVWSKDNRFGVALDRPFAEGDSLLAAAVEEAATLRV